VGDTRVTVRARVRVTLDIDVSDCWGGDCPMSQVVRQARDSALGRLRQVFAEDTRKSIHIAGVEHVDVTTREEGGRG
jgi:hypothetical protein